MSSDDAQSRNIKFARRGLLTLAILLALYLVCFGSFVNVISGTYALSVGGSHVTHTPAPFIYVSGSSKTVNIIAKVIWYPLIKTGERAGWWRFLDDASDFEGYGKSLLRYQFHL